VPPIASELVHCSDSTKSANRLWTHAPQQNSIPIQ
jgi:hypothetical protein